MTGTELIQQEGERRITTEGWTACHDDSHIKGELAQAGACYALEASGQGGRIFWPWKAGQSFMGWKPSTDPVSNLFRAGALIAAEIDRLQRKATNAT